MNMHRLVTGGAAVVLATVLAAGACAESLWNTQKGSLFQDMRARQKGDIVTVLVVESATATQAATTETSRESGNSIGPGFGPILHNVKAVGNTGTSSSKGSGTTERSSNLVTKITATVTDVQDNGNLVIQAERQTVTNQEKQKATLTGVIRPTDITPDNTVLSTNIADAHIELTGDGPVGSRQKEGVFTKVLRFLF